MADYELLYLLMNKLPKNGIWTKKERDKFINAYIALVDLLIDIKESKPVMSGDFSDDAKLALKPFVNFWNEISPLHLRAKNNDIFELQKRLKKFPLRHFEFAKQVYEST